MILLFNPNSNSLVEKSSII